MLKLTHQQAYEIGISHGYDLAIQSGSSNPGVDGWDGLLINANPGFAKERLGWDGDRTSSKAKRRMEKYCEGCQVGANAAVFDLANEV